MGRWLMENCANHPDRIAIEGCEVCGKPLCAYCLYYTEDGQRLCAQHAEHARLAGLRIEEPGAYAEQLIGAQAGMWRDKHKRDKAGDATLYKGNTTDLIGLMGVVLGLLSLSMCCGAFIVLPFVAFVLSLVAFISAKNAHDPSRTRQFGLIGLLVSGVWVFLLVAVFLVQVPWLNSSVSFQPISISNPSSATDTPTPTPSPTSESQTEDAADPAAWTIQTPAPNRRESNRP